SARSITGIDLGAAVIAANNSGLLLGGGGHAMAAGFSVEEAKITALRDFFNQRLSESVTALSRERTLHIDGLVSLNGVNADLVRLIERAGPFGAGNPSARLVLSSVKIVRADVVGEDHVRVILADSGASGASVSLKAMAFRSAKTPLGQ